MKIYMQIILLSFLTGYSFNLIAAAASLENNQVLDFSKAWFKPTLTENKDPVCTSLLTQSQRDFFSTPSKQYNSEVGPIPSDQHWKQQGELLEPLLIEGKSVYVRRFFGRGCGGACESEHMAASKTPFPTTDSYGSDISFNVSAAPTTPLTLAA